MKYAYIQRYLCNYSTCQQYTKYYLLAENYILSVLSVLDFPDDAKSCNIFIMLRTSFFQMFWTEWNIYYWLVEDTN